MAANSILIGCDLGGTTRTVLEAGLALADGLQAPATLVHVDDYGHLLSERFHAVDPEALARMRASYADDATAELRQLLEKMGRTPASLDLRVREGRTYEQLVETAQTEGALAIVVGSHGRHPAEHPGVGRTATRVVRHAHCAVLTVQVGREWGGISRILFATDLTERQREAARWAARLAGAFAARLILLHVSELGGRLAGPYVFPPPDLDRYYQYEIRDLDALKSEMARLAAEQGRGEVAVQRLFLVAPDVTSTILEVAKREHVDLIVMGTHGRKPIARAFLGSVAEGVLHRASTSVMTVREPEAPA
jgi:nucleotide-binding universal stress UspA family protein